MTVGIISKIWKRPALTRAFLDYYSALEVPGVRFVRVAAISPQEDPTVADVVRGHLAAWGNTYDGWFFVNAPNAPLSDKGNLACYAIEAHEWRPDVVINVGSDDFVNAHYVRAVIDAVEAGAGFVVPSELFIYDLPTGRLCRCFNNHSMKAGAAISADLLDVVDWQPWQAEGKAPDKDMDRRLPRDRRFLLPEGSAGDGPSPMVVDVKGAGISISSYDQFRYASKHREDADPSILDKSFPELLEVLSHARAAGVPA